ncbi:M23 family metallopeptidase [Leptospira sp. GIMC2001]|uniref:M23 family metallopeptidase n=1 Tax=Leptospira sp. GIMC2001 TaxID=1513297 RepID=UPI00234BF66C|nr:M23 family metallopeptidase [Leptospira sp. GIMC2001]WCL48158.1 M23 family metallopeptidase [Leptospira sp. GIMC2001]
MENLTQTVTLYEKMQMKYIRMRNRFKKWQIKGREKISFMVIPHSEKVVISLDMSFSMLLFLSFLASLLFVLSLGFLVYYSFIFDRNEEIFLTSNQDQTTFIYYNLLSEDLEESVRDLESQTEKLNMLAWDEVSWKRLITQDYFPEITLLRPDYNEMETNLNLYPQTVLAYSEMSVRLKKLEPVFHNGIDYLDMRESIFLNIPRGRPLGAGVGNVTSSWGNRMDPFGILPVGEFHSGIDFAAAEGTPIYATASGYIPKTEFSTGGLGRSVRINHDNGFFTLYGHCSQILVKEGDVVKRGDKIALVGQTGKATGAHVHYEVRIGLDSPMDPEEFINLD